MLKQETIAIIKSTVPVLEEHGVAVTKRFYELLFTNHPELLNLFNHANQKQGRQQGALANAVYAAALHIDRLETILPVVKGIAHKHRSLGVKPEHYPVVGEHLLLAMKDVLGDGATEEVLAAWGDAYQVIADAFIGVEKSMYEEAEGQHGGWEGFRAFRVERRVKESEVITSFYLEPEDGKAIADFLPGQYVSVKLDIPGEAYTHIRQYSLSDSPGKPYYRISVKREEATSEKPEGTASNALHRYAEEGERIWLSAPAGQFVLDQDDDRPVVLLSGGVGITPMMSMLKTLAEAEVVAETKAGTAKMAIAGASRPVTFIHAARNGEFHAMREQTDELAEAHEHITVYYCYQNPTEDDRKRNAFHREGFIEREWLELITPGADAVYYFCGPIPFMKQINQHLKQLGVPESSIYYEFFGPAGQL
ncbi:NO-inducible flavohemoprotein [Paenibacillus sp. HB172176]|uniref:NO-inducible flavohemoprotein n=1 Tax=Paenibacillus sp. HB172176 TaxID=2493690 RepID=UPI00143976C0|nr:NO-inducible flavohemoprotein [Paenibacillus sp. HB172176]